LLVNHIGFNEEKGVVVAVLLTGQLGQVHCPLGQLHVPVDEHPQSLMVEAVCFVFSRGEGKEDMN
jgi:hypothetical protein